MNKSNSKVDVTVLQPNVLSLIDFCKGLAISWVFLFHYRPEWFGWQGVHIFIVLSGFGLTYSCLKKTGIISWKQWYLKRAERILPTYWLVSLCGFLIMLCLYIFTKHEVAVNKKDYIIDLLLNILLLKNLSVQRIFSPPNDPLWFIPLLIGFYLVFPWLYHLILKYKTIKGSLLVLLAVAVIEFVYRAISIYYFDGAPIGYEQHLIKGLSVFPLKPLNNIPNTFFLFPFQLQAPFGLFLSRIAEFTLGMLGAKILVQNSQKFHDTFINYRLGLVGVFIWIAGYTLVFTRLWTWIFADLIIAIGIVLAVVNLAWIFQNRFTFLFIKLGQIGAYSYYIFLTHGVFIYLFFERQPIVVVYSKSLYLSFFKELFMFLLLISATGVSSWLLMKFDKSKFPKLIVQKTIGRFFQ